MIIIIINITRIMIRSNQYMQHTDESTVGVSDKPNI